MASRSSAALRRNPIEQPAQQAPVRRRPRVVSNQTPSHLSGPISDAELRRQVSECAYYKAQQRGFSPGFELEDWVAAETEVMHRLGLYL